MRSGKKSANGSDPILRVDHVTKKFGELVAVNDLSFSVEDGQIFGIAGPNGAGKSTVYNLITGFYPYEGHIEFNGRELSGMPPYKIAKAGIARTFQIPQIFPSLTVEKSISVGSRFGSRDGLDEDHVAEIIRFVELSDEKNQKTGHLNLLGKKKLMIGAALATKPEILMLDEPSLGLAPLLVKEIFENIKRINQEMDTTLLIVEQNAKIALEISTYAYIMESGKIVLEGPSKELKNNPDVKEFYMGVTQGGGRKSLKEVKSYKSCKRWM